MPFEVVSTLPGRLGAAQATFALTGGLHATGLFTAGGELLCTPARTSAATTRWTRSPGWALGEGLLPLSRSICVSGRLSFELVQKAAVAGCPRAGRGRRASSLAVELGADRGITLCGFVRDGRAGVYTEPSRILA